MNPPIPDPQHALQAYKAKAYVCPCEVPKESALRCYVRCMMVTTVSPLVCLCSAKTGVLCTALYIYVLPTICSHLGHSRSQGELWPTWDVTQSTEPSLHFMLCDYKWIWGLGCPSLRLSVRYLFMTFYLACCISTDGFVFEQQYSHIFKSSPFHFPFSKNSPFQHDF